MRILVVEDQEELAASLKARLESECYAVDVEHDGERGLYRARTNEYDMIVLDNILPGKLGPDVCRELREYRMTTPILILSVQSEIDQKVSLLDCGADDYLTKPFSFTELSARVRALLRRPAQMEMALGIDNLTLDKDRFGARRGNREIYLTQKEFMLLEYMVRNRGKVLTRAAIMEPVWNKDVDEFSNAIETHIRNLRRKIDCEGERKLIHTLIGRGYKIDVES